MTPALLVLAKAPRAGQVKTRLAATVGDDTAADLAALALLDTLQACHDTGYPCHLALAGALAGAVRETDLREALAPWHVFDQHGNALAERIAHAHATVHDSTGGPVVQIGMDTPHVTASDLAAAAEALADSPGVLGPAYDGGWWLLGLHDPANAAALVDVPMSRPDTGSRTRAALECLGLTLSTTRPLRDVDTAADAEVVASEAPDTRFARAWRAVRGVDATGARR